MFASERFLTSVGELVPLQAPSLSTLVAALIAVKGLFFTVGEHVPLKVTCSCTFIAAFLAAEGLLSTVSTNVLL